MMEPKGGACDIKNTSLFEHIFDAPGFQDLYGPLPHLSFIGLRHSNLCPIGQWVELPCDQGGTHKGRP